jgi:hypothetical protein
LNKTTPAGTQRPDRQNAKLAPPPGKSSHLQGERSSDERGNVASAGSSKGAHSQVPSGATSSGLPADTQANRQQYETRKNRRKEVYQERQDADRDHGNFPQAELTQQCYITVRLSSSLLRRRTITTHLGPQGIATIDDDSLRDTLGTCFGPVLTIQRPAPSSAFVAFASTGAAQAAIEASCASDVPGGVPGGGLLMKGSDGIRVRIVVQAARPPRKAPPSAVSGQSEQQTPEAELTRQCYITVRPSCSPA